MFELTASWHGSITHSMLRLLPALTQARGIMGPFSRTPYCISAPLPDVIRVLFPRAIPLSITSTPALSAHPCFSQQGNTFVKNLARQGGLLPLLLAVMRGCASSHPQTAVSFMPGGSLCTSYLGTGT